MDPTTIAASVNALLKAAIEASEAPPDNPFGDIGNPTHVTGLVLASADLAAAKRISAGIDAAIAQSDQAKLNALLAAVQPFLPSPVGLLGALGGIFV